MMQPSMQDWAWALQMGAPLQIPKNLYTVLIVMDPLDNSSTSQLKHIMQYISQLIQLMQQRFSIRIAFLFINSHDITQTQTSQQTSLTQTAMWLTMRMNDQYGAAAA